MRKRFDVRFNVLLQVSAPFLPGLAVGIAFFCLWASNHYGDNDFDAYLGLAIATLLFLATVVIKRWLPFAELFDTWTSSYYLDRSAFDLLKAIDRPWKFSGFAFGALCEAAERKTNAEMNLHNCVDRYEEVTTFREDDSAIHASLVERAKQNLTQEDKRYIRIWNFVTNDYPNGLRILDDLPADAEEFREDPDRESMMFLPL